jgi:hypothetical protein
MLLKLNIFPNARFIFGERAFLMTHPAGGRTLVIGHWSLVIPPLSPVDNRCVRLANWCIYTRFSEANVDWDRIIIKLLGGFVVLLTAFAVLLGGSALATALADELGGRVLLWVAMSALLLLLTNGILLLLVVAIRSLGKPPE